jgi:hypothetical protein
MYLLNDECVRNDADDFCFSQNLGSKYANLLRLFANVRLVLNMAEL